MRTIIDLSKDQLEILDAWCAREGVSRAEGVRRAVHQYLIRERPPEPHRAYGLWKGRRETGLAYQRRVRREWDQRP